VDSIASSWSVVDVDIIDSCWCGYYRQLLVWIL